jgi:hypothetical protein
MNPRSDPWQRLVRAARLAPAEPLPSPSLGFEARVLAAWRAETAADDWSIWTTPLRAGVVCASLVMVLCLALVFFARASREPNELAIADYIVLTSLSR